MKQQEAIQKLTEIFRNSGYEGSSLGQLSKAAGLSRSSLYHHFKAGKQEMATLVLKEMQARIKGQVIDVLGANHSPQKKLNQALEALDEVYQGGETICLLRSLSIGKGLELFQPLIEQSFEKLWTAFRELGIEVGNSYALADKLALDSLIKIQGSLVLSRSMERPEIFKNALKEIYKLFFPEE